jgi:DNA polymerase-2
MFADQESQRRGLPLQYQNKGIIRYLNTLAGPQPLEYISSAIDYDHYIEKQIQPIAEAILPAIGLNFSAIVDDQLGLF